MDTTSPSISMAPPPSSNWTFTQGFVLGQASFIVIVLIFIRYVVFSPTEAVDANGYKDRRAERAKRSKLSTTGVPAPAPAQILSKTGYEMATHPAESTDWLNVLFAQILQGYRNDLLSEGGEEGARQRIEQWLNPENGKMPWLDPIQVTALSLGNSYPLLSNARLRPSDGSGHVRSEIDIDYLDSVSLSLSTSILINFPRPRFAVLPVAIGVELVSIGGTLSLEIHDPPRERQHLHASLLPDFHLNLRTTTLLGSRAKLQDIPKLEQLILSRLRSAVQDRLVHPRHLSFALPRLLSPSVSPTPLINDLGDDAVHAIDQAIRSGMARMVDDLVQPLNALTNSGQLAKADASMQHDPVSPSVGLRQRKMHMPAAFPRTGPSSTNTPLATPQPRTGHSFPHKSSAAGSGTGDGESLHAMPPYSSASASDQFKFRGQFASRPPTGSRTGPSDAQFG